MSLTEQERLRVISLPSKLGQHLAQDIWGEPYVPFPFVQYMEQRIIEAVLDTTHERYVAIAAPPQTGKSSYVGLLLPFWLTGMFPAWQVMYLSYSDDFSTAKGKDVRAMHQRWGRELFGTAIDPDFSAGTDWRIKGSRGGMLSAGIGGQITGRPGNVIIIDDLIKNAEEARSKATKGLHVAEWDGTINRRIQPGTTVILIATRWAEDDLQGVLKARMAEPGYDGPRWEFIEYPAFAEMPEDLELTEAERDEWRDVLGRKEGEVLDCRFSRIEGRDPADFFNLAKAGMDRYAWSALYQQHPSVTEGGMFPKDAWVYESQETWPDMVEVVRVWDLAVTEDAGDFTVGTKVGRGSDGRFYIMDVQRFRKAAGGVQDAVELQAHLDGFATRIMIEEEKGAAGKTVIEFYKRLLPMRRVDPAKAEGDKVSRATPYSAQQNRHQVVLPLRAEASWSVADFVDEHAKLMPDGRGPRNDDQIDTAAYGVASLIDAAAADIWMPSQGGLQVSAEAQMRRLLTGPVDVLSGWSTR